MVYIYISIVIGIINQLITWGHHLVNAICIYTGMDQESYGNPMGYGATMGNHREEAGSLGPIFHDLDVPSCSTDFPRIFSSICHWYMDLPVIFIEMFHFSSDFPLMFPLIHWFPIGVPSILSIGPRSIACWFAVHAPRDEAVVFARTSGSGQPSKACHFNGLLPSESGYD